MSLRLQMLLILFTCITLFLIIRNVRKGIMNVHYSIAWVIGVFVLLTFALFPDFLYGLTALAGIEKPVNAIYLIVIFIVLVLLFSLFTIISKQADQILRLTYKVAELEKRMHERKEDCE